MAPPHISLAEARHVHQQGTAAARRYGPHRTVALSQEATAYFKRHHCQMELLTSKVLAVAELVGTYGR